jgi:hypothetical protein
MNETEMADLKADFTQIIDKAVQDGIVNLQKLHDKMGRDIEGGAYALEQAMYFNGVKEENKFNEQMNVLVRDFLNKTETGMGSQRRGEMQGTRNRKEIEEGLNTILGQD